MGRGSCIFLPRYTQEENILQARVYADNNIYFNQLCFVVYYFYTIF
jgi:hypothetical protein